MLLSQYLLTVRNLIQSPTSPVPLVPDSLLILYINLARAQTAIDAECVRTTGNSVIQPGTIAVPLSDVVPMPMPPGLGTPLVVRNAYLDRERVDIRPWDWFANYYWGGTPNLPVIPTPVMAHQGQGTFSTLFFNSPGGALVTDLVVLPVDLVSDATPDAIPYPWVDAVAFYACWYAYMTMQRQADAQMFIQRYSEVLRRGRTTTTSTALPENDPGGVGAILATTKTPIGASPPRAPQQGGGG